MSTENYGSHEQSSKETQPKRAPSHRARRRRRRSGTGVLLLALIVCVGGIIMFRTARELNRKTVYPGVTLCGYDLSKQTEEEARRTVSNVLEAQPVEQQTLTIRVGGEEFPLSLEECGVGYDAEETFESVWNVGRSGSRSERLKEARTARRHGYVVPAAVHIDEQVLAQQAEEIAAASGSTVEQSSWTLEDGVLRIDKGAAGYGIDTAALSAQVLSRLQEGDYSPLDVTPEITSPALLDANAIAAELDHPVAEPTLDLEADPTGKTVKPGVSGAEVDLVALQQALESDERYAEVKVLVHEPKYSDEEYRSLLFRDVLAEASTSYDASNVGRTTNVHLAVEACDGVILMPGDIFSYNDVVGPRTYERGFMDAIVYVGTLAEAGVGGGICQVSSTIYYAVLRADLEIVERYAHSRTVTYVPLGEDATVAWGSKDFRFRNNTDFPIKVVTSHGRSSLTVNIVGTQTVANKVVKIDTKTLSYNPFEVVYETDPTLAPGETKVKSNGYSGYVTESYRVVYIDGEEVSRTFENKSVYTRYDKVIQQNPLPAVSTDPQVPATPGETQEPTTPSTPTDPTEPTEPPTSGDDIPIGEPEEPTEQTPVDVEEPSEEPDTSSEEPDEEPPFDVGEE